MMCCEAGNFQKGDSDTEDDAGAIASITPLKAGRSKMPFCHSMVHQ